jgi:hypothetical protein
MKIANDNLPFYKHKKFTVQITEQDVLIKNCGARITELTESVSSLQKKKKEIEIEKIQVKVLVFSLSERAI